MNDTQLERQLNDAASDAISKIEELEDDNETLQDEISGLRDELQEKRDEIDELNDQIQELQAKIEEFEGPDHVNVKIWAAQY